VSNCDHVVGAYFRDDGDVAGEIEMNRQWDEFVQRHEVVWCDQWHVENQDECFVFWFVYVRSFDQKKVGRLVNERKHVAVLSNVINIFHHGDQGFVIQGSPMRSVSLANLTLL